jgi:DNA-binding beta-propeller fold protein YncE
VHGSRAGAIAIERGNAANLVATTSTGDRMGPKSFKSIVKAAALAACLGLAAASAASAPAALYIPGGKAGIGFDDISFAPALGKVIVPAGRTGELDLIDPATRRITIIGGFTAHAAFGGFHAQGVTSADTGAGMLFTADRDAMKLDVVDPRARMIVASAPLGGEPDYVRFVPATREVWVTEPRAARIEVFSIPREGVPAPAPSGFIAIPGGPESLAIDAKRSRAYANRFTDTTVAIDLKSRKIAAQWSNGCKGSRGLALDDARGMLMVGCAEGALHVLDLASGKVVGAASSGDGVDIIAYNPRLAHAYLPGAKSATMAMVGISAAGAARVLATVATAKYAHCAAADDRDNVYVCDPVRGRLLVFHDSYPAAK